MGLVDKQEYRLGFENDLLFPSTTFDCCKFFFRHAVSSGKVP